MHSNGGNDYREPPRAAHLYGGPDEIAGLTNAGQQRVDSPSGYRSQPSVATVPFEVPQDEKTLIDALLRTRAGYDEEVTWHRFLLSAYSGTGGFCGKVRQPLAGWWGRGAEAYSITSTFSTVGAVVDVDTYLDRFSREDGPKFRERCELATYTNYVGPVLDLRLSYLSRKPVKRDGVERLSEWLDDCDGAGTPETVRRDQIIPRAAVLGWTPIIVDTPEDADLYASRAAQKDAGVGPRVIPLFPINLTDYKLDDRKRFEWVKLRIDREEQADPFTKPIQVAHISIWTRDVCMHFEIIVEKSDRKLRAPPKRIPNPFGRIPVVIWKHAPTPDDPVKGIPMGGAISTLARRHFNITSEALDEHLRKCAFSFLQVPTKNPNTKGSIELGNGNALPILDSASRDYRWVGPDPQVSAVLTTRRDGVREEIYRVARTDPGRGVAVDTQSGVAKAYDFEGTNRAIADFAMQLAASEQQTLRLVHGADGGPEADAEKIRITPATKFDVEEMTTQLNEALSADKLGLPPTAMREIKKRVVENMLPNLDDETHDEIEEEFEQEAEADEQKRAMEEAMREAAAKGPADENADPNAPPPVPGQGPPTPPVPPPTHTPPPPPPRAAR